MKLTRILTSASAILAAVAIAAAQEAPAAKVLMPGDKAPELKVAEWVQGKPITTYQKGRVYIVEFWATWCGPCIDSIPHLNEIAKKNAAKVDVVGVNIWEDLEGRKERVVKFVKDMGKKMEYRVAIDTANADTTERFMDASFSEGIPTAFIVNEEGIIAWIGHPMGLEEPLNAVLAKKHDIKAAREEYRQQIEEAQARRKILGKLDEAEALYLGGDKEKAIALIDEVSAAGDDYRMDANMRKISLFLKDDVPAAKELITKLSTGEYNDQMTVAITSIEQATAENGNREIALFAANAVIDNMKKDDPFVLYYCSPAFSVTGDHKKALAVLERSLKAFDDSPYAKEEQMKSFRSEIAKAIEEEKKLIDK